MTGRKEAALESGQLLEKIFSNIHVLIAYMDRDFNFIRVNRTYARADGRDPEFYVGKNHFDLFPNRENQEIFRRVVETGEPYLASRRSFVYERNPERGVTYWDWILEPIKEADGRVGGLLLSLVDVTEAKRAELALRESEEKYRSLIENMREGVWVIDPDARTVFVNARLAEMLGYAAEDLLGRPAADFLEKSQQESFKRRFELRKRGLSEQYQVTLIRKDGAPIYVEVKAAPTFDAEGRFAAAIACISDISQEKRLREQLLQSGKMEAIGRLAGGVAHDFNNLLTVISGHCERLLRSLPGFDPVRSGLEEIRKAGDLAAGLTRQLLAFSRGQILKPAVLDLNHVVSGIQTMLGRLIGEDIDLVADLDPSLGRVKVDPAQVEQVLMNLVLNARDAMPRGGRLTIQTRNAQLGEESARQCAGAEPGPFCVLSVSDTGCGMDQETQSHLFEPFFTTKAEGKGTGLGLSTAYGIVKQSGGHIEVYSEPGLGSMFKVYLPRVEEPLSAAGQKADVKPVGHPETAETILLVEDQELIRNLTRRILVDCGYSVLEAPDGKKALQICERHPGAIHLLVTDVVIPEIDGWELFQRASKIRPDIRVLFVSGYARSAVLDRALDRGLAFLEKPYSLSALTGKVREVLDGTAESPR